MTSATDVCACRCVSAAALLPLPAEAPAEEAQRLATRHGAGLGLDDGLRHAITDARGLPFWHKHQLVLEQVCDRVRSAKRLWRCTAAHLRLHACRVASVHAASRAAGRRHQMLVQGAVCHAGRLRMQAPVCSSA
jgi:hypothetical protein